MKVASLRETIAGENRAALVPASVAKFVKAGFEVAAESNIGLAAGYRDTAYIDAGAEILPSREATLTDSDVVLGVQTPTAEQIAELPEGSIHLSYLDPFNSPELLSNFATRGISAISLEMIPRSTIAQKMDVVSSQASLGGYAAMIMAASSLNMVFPMMMTPAGTLSPARVFVIGAGVAGLQAIATAQRLGARVEAFDTRPVVKEEVQSLGAKFLEIDIGETGQTEQGYARELTSEQLELQRQGMKDAIARADIVITTAQVFGRAAPRIVTSDMIEAMKPRSVVIDMAAETGGNVEGSKPGKTVEVNEVKVIGPVNLPSTIATHASQMFANNLYELINHFKVEDEPRVDFSDLSNDILARCLLTQGHEVLYQEGTA